MTRPRLRRFLAAFDWKLIISLFALCVVLVVLLGKVQDTQTIDRQDKALAKANDTVERNSRIIEQLNNDAAARSLLASRERKALVRRIDLLTTILRSNGLEVPDSATELSSDGITVVPQRSGSTARPRSTTPTGTGSAGGSGGTLSGGTAGGSSGGGAGTPSTPAPTTPPRRGPLSPVTQLPIVCALTGPCPEN